MAGCSGIRRRERATVREYLNKPSEIADFFRKLPRTEQFPYCKNKHLQSTITNYSESNKIRT